MTRSYGSTDLSPGAGASASESSIGAQVTSTIAIGSRLFSASDMRPWIIIRPTRRHSSVRPSNASPSSTGADGVAAAAPSGAFFRFRKSNGTSFLRRSGILADGLHHGRVRKGGGVAEHPALGDVAKEATHDLARPGLGQVRNEQQRLRASDRPDDRRDVLPKGDRQRIGWLLVRLEDHEREDRLSRDLVLLADDRRLGHRLVVHQGGFDLGR